MPKFLLNFKYYDIKRIVLIKNKLIAEVTQPFKKALS